ncbi:MAG: putative colanic acid biosynthesis acetyltransferase [Okeania sp. SIO3B3]|nr:putative colanic acid biosynthesis acetyltransferase [Okeania sp. SIO3B3]
MSEPQESASFHQPAFSRKNRLMRLAWGVVEVVLFRLSPRPMHRWRCMLLKLFGAKLGTNVAIYPRTRVWAPWNLACGSNIGIADEAIIYNPSPITLGDYVTVSQQAYLCGASHDVMDPDFPLIHAPITLHNHAWICARATVQMGVTVGEGAVLALGGVATKNLQPWTIYAGIPAKAVKKRELTKP